MENKKFIPNVTVFRSIFNTTDRAYKVSIEEVFKRISRGIGEKTKPIVEKIRASHDHDEIQELKKQLPAIMFNGIFQTRQDNAMIEHSGLCIFDFDKYPDIETMMQAREIIIKDKYTYACFISPSGKGLKVLVKIPPSNKNEHYRRFHAYRDYIDSDYFDEKTSNLSRVCFESYDPTIYINYESELFKDIQPEQAKNFLKEEPKILLTDTNEIIQKILSMDLGVSYVEGSRNNYIFQASCAFCEFDISQEDAIRHFSSYVGDGIGISEIERTIRSAYKKSANNLKRYWNDSKKEELVKQKIAQGHSKKQIAQELKIDEQTVDEIKKETNEAIEVFWTVKKTKMGTFVNIDPEKFKIFLTQNGFQKYYPENSETYIFVRVIENKVNVVTVEKIKDFVLDYLNRKKHKLVWNEMASRPSYFSDRYLNFLDPINLKMIQDTKDESYIPYLNGILKVTKDSKKVISYLDIDNYIWEKQITPRVFKETDEFNNDFSDFVSKVTNNDEDRRKALECCIGYLISTYKDKSHQKAIIFNDQEIDDNPNGGSGKSLMLTALSKFRNVVKIDGKHFNPMKSDFVYQRVNFDTQILAFDDVRKNFNLEQLFPLITEGITVNKKNKDEIFIPFERAPKIVITTNHVIAGAGESHDRRRHEIEFFQYFNKSRNPLKEYGRLLFDQWNEDDWVKFDNYMVSNLQSFLRYGLVYSPSINIETKRFISSTCKEFFDFMNEGFIEHDIPVYNTHAVNLFLKENRFFKELDTRTFLKWIGEYCNYKGYELKKDKTHKGRLFVIVTEKEDENQIKIPFG